VNYISVDLGGTETIETWWIGDKRENKNTCPLCDSEGAYYNENYKTWKRLKCEKSFAGENLRPTKDIVRG